MAFFVNGGWDFLTPATGWQVWVMDEAVRLTYDGSIWSSNLLAASINRAAMRADVVEADVVIGGGASSEVTSLLIPSHCSVWGVTGRVLEGISGALTSWSLGVDGFDDRYGASLGLNQNSSVKGITGQPVTYYEPTPLRLTASGGDFAGGSVRLAVHLMQFDLPNGA